MGQSPTHTLASRFGERASPAASSQALPSVTQNVQSSNQFKFDFGDFLLRSSLPPSDMFGSPEISESNPHLPSPGPSQPSRAKKIRLLSSKSALSSSRNYYTAPFQTLPQEINALIEQRQVVQGRHSHQEAHLSGSESDAPVSNGDEPYMDEEEEEDASKGENVEATTLIRRACIGCFLLDIKNPPPSILPYPSLRTVENQQVDKLVKSIDELGDFREDHPIFLLMERDDLDLSMDASTGEAIFKPLHNNSKITCIAGNHRLQAAKLIYTRALEEIKELEAGISNFPEDTQLPIRHQHALDQLSRLRWWPVRVYDSGK